MHIRTTELDRYIGLVEDVLTKLEALLIRESERRRAYRQRMGEPDDPEHNNQPMRNPCATRDTTG